MIHSGRDENWLRRYDAMASPGEDDDLGAMTGILLCAISSLVFWTVLAWALLR